MEIQLTDENFEEEVLKSDLYKVDRLGLTPSRRTDLLRSIF